MKIKPLEWSDPMPPNEDIRYDHTICTTPFGQFILTWKSWKDDDVITVDEAPWYNYADAIGYIGPYYSLEEAKVGCAEEFAKRIQQSIGQETT